MKFADLRPKYRVQYRACYYVGQQYKMVYTTCISRVQIQELEVSHRGELRSLATTIRRQKTGVVVLS